MKALKILFPVGILAVFCFCSAGHCGLLHRTYEEGDGKHPSRAAAGESRLKKITTFVTRMEGGFLYTPHSRYSLTGVTVIDRTNGKETPTGAKRVVEMTFVGNDLQEVVIRH